MLMSVQGEYYSSDYQLGLFEEKDKQCKKYGHNCGICSVVSFSFQGCIKSEKNLRNHIAARMSYLKKYIGGAVGEIVSLEKPVKYLLISPEVIEEDCKYKRMMETQSRNETHRRKKHQLSLMLCSMTFLRRFSKSLRENMTMAPQPRHFTLISAPIRIISHCVDFLQGWALFISIISCKPYSIEVTSLYMI